MKQLMKLVALAGVATMLIGAMAFAAKPKPGGVYAGTSDANDDVAIYAETKKNLSQITVTDDCDEDWLFKDVKVKKGKFKAVDKGDLDFPVFTIKGKFKADGVVKGEISSVTCSGSERNYKLDQVA